MKKYPFSKKAMNIMLATALVATPVATLAPIGGGVVAEAAATQSQKEEIAALIEVIASINSASSKADLEAAEAKANAVLEGTSIESSDVLEAVAAAYHVALDKGTAGLIMGGIDGLVTDALKENAVKNLDAAIKKEFSVSLNDLYLAALDIQEVDYELKLELFETMKEVQKSTQLNRNATVDEFYTFMNEVYSNLDEETIEALREERKNLDTVDWDKVVEEVLKKPSSGGGGGGGAIVDDADKKPVNFKDLPSNHWAKQAIDTLSSLGILEGYPNGTFQPGRVTTRAEFATVVSRALDLPKAGSYDKRFSDVKGSEWYVETLLPAVEAGLIEGRANGTFDASAAITRQEAAAIVSRALAHLKIADDKFDTSKSADKFKDVAAIAPWAEKDVERAVQAGILEGHANGTFEARGDTTRAEVAQMTVRLLEIGDLLEEEK